MAKGSDSHVCRCKACGCPNTAVNAELCWPCGQGIHKLRKRR